MKSKFGKLFVKAWIFIITVILIFLVAVIILAFSSSFKKEKTGAESVSTESLSVAEDVIDWNSTMEQNQKEMPEAGEIIMPGYKDLYVTEKEPNIYLNNPEENNVYFQYSITDESGNILYQKDDLIEPGKAATAELFSVLKKGEHTILIQISTYDMETRQPCNGAVQKSKILVD